MNRGGLETLCDIRYLAGVFFSILSLKGKRRRTHINLAFLHSPFLALNNILPRSGWTSSWNGDTFPHHRITPALAPEIQRFSSDLLFANVSIFDITRKTHMIHRKNGLLKPQLRSSVRTSCYYIVAISMEGARIYEGAGYDTTRRPIFSN